MTATPLTGRVVAARYEVGELFEHAQSLNSKLWTHLGRDRDTGREVLVVALRPEWARDPAVRAEHEWGLDRIATLAHGGILAIAAREVDEATGAILFVTELLPWHSHSLARLLNEGAVYSETQVVELGRLVLDALAHAHGRDVVFGNIKPANLVITQAVDRVVINGLPKPPFAFASIPQLGAYLGKPFACAPELLATGRFDARADLYGLGLVLYEIAAGRLPFRVSDHLGVLFGSIIHDPLPPVTELNPDVSPKLADVIARAVAKDPAARFPSATDMLAALRKVQPRSIAMLTRARLGQMIATSLPSPIAYAHAAIERQLDDSARLQCVVDATQACLTFAGSIAIAARHHAKVAPAIPDEAARSSFGRPSLGHWAAIVREGSRAATFPALATLMFERGKPSPAARAIDELVSLRNEVRHGAAPSATVARRLLAEHGPLLERVLADLLPLREHWLVVPRTLDFTGDEFACDVDILRGLHADRRAIRVAQPLSIGKVYLANADFTRLLPLAPLLVMTACPVCEDDELFFYESASDERIHYLSYRKGHSLASADAYAAFTKAGLL